MSQIELKTPEDTLKFVTFIEEALPYVDEWTPTEINAGGCGIFAGLLYDKLTEEGLPCEIYALYMDKDEDESERNLRNFISNNGGPEKAGADHIVTKCLHLYLDSHGIINPVVLQARDKILLTREQLQVIDEHSSSWNSMFDRDCTPFIQGKITEIFTKYDTYQEGCFPNPKENQIEYTQHTIEEREKHSDPFEELFGGHLPEGLFSSNGPE
jgi:hypothetical protein